MTHPLDATTRHGERLPLPDDEADALADAERLLVGFHCPKCGREWVTGKTTVMLWHSCRVDVDYAQRRQTRAQFPARRYDNAEEIRHADRERWRSTSPVIDGLEEALGARAYLDGDT